MRQAAPDDAQKSKNQLYLVSLRVPHRVDLDVLRQSHSDHLIIKEYVCVRPSKGDQGGSSYRKSKSDGFLTPVWWP